MSPLAISLVTFAIIFGGMLLGYDHARFVARTLCEGLVKGRRETGDRYDRHPVFSRPGLADRL